jgi:hypothetical protein
MEKRAGRHSATLTIPLARAGGKEEPKEKSSGLECEGLRPPSCGEACFARAEQASVEFWLFWLARGSRLPQRQRVLLLLPGPDYSFEQWYQRRQIAVDDFPENIEIDGIVAVNESIAKADNL